MKENTTVWCSPNVHHIVPSMMQLLIYMCLVLPMPPWPAWVAPLFWPACSPTWASLPFLISSSVKFLSFLVAILGPRRGPLYSGCFWVWRANAYRHRVT